MFILVIEDGKIHRDDALKCLGHLEMKNNMDFSLHPLPQFDDILWLICVCPHSFSGVVSSLYPMRQREGKEQKRGRESKYRVL